MKWFLEVPSLSHCRKVFSGKRDVRADFYGETLIFSVGECNFGQRLRLITVIPRV
jgi:hypothetical protein